MTDFPSSPFAHPNSITYQRLSVSIPSRAGARVFGFGFAEFKTKERAIEALAKLNGATLDNRKITVSPFDPKAIHEVNYRNSRTSAKKASAFEAKKAALDEESAKEKVAKQPAADREAAEEEAAEALTLD
ncbi:hypothetical protein IAT38_000983 [Cryptococcus sp. DSM 104549]